MNKKEIDIVINSDGTIDVEAFGFEGNQCEQSINAIFKNIGKATSQRNKSEYNRINKGQIKQQLKT